MHDSGCFASQSQVVPSVREVSGVEIGGSQVFYPFKGRELGCKLRRGKEELEVFSGKFNTSGEGIKRKLLEVRQNGSGLAVVESHSAARRLVCKERNGGTESFESQVGDNAEPAEERRSRRVPTG